MGWFIRKSTKVGPFRLNLSKRGLGISAGMRGLRVGTGPRGPYVAGGRDGIYFRQNLRHHRRSTRPASHTGHTSTPLATIQSTEQSGESTTIETPFVPRRYPLGLLVPMLIFSLLPWITSGFPQTGMLGAISNLIFGILFIDLLAAMILDWRGFTTLNGRIHWSRHGFLWKSVMVSVYVVLFMIMLPVYLIFALKDQRRAYEYARLEQQRHIAELESEMGIMPATDGACPHCHKPLQVGAEFCAYCGARAVARARVCPVCATTTLPDAKWCPHCGASLDGASSTSMN